MIHRRSFLLGLGSVLAAPAVVRAASLMPVRTLPLAIPPEAVELLRRCNAELEAMRRWEYFERLVNPPLIHLGGNRFKTYVSTGAWPLYDQGVPLPRSSRIKLDVRAA